MYTRDIFVWIPRCLVKTNV